MNPKAFIQGLDHRGIVAAIRRSEARSRGEIRVHVEGAAVDDARGAAALVFEKLGMARTQERNGVLIFVAPKTKHFAVIGDSGIHAKCGEAFWASLAADLEADFRREAFSAGIIKTVERVGASLAEHFPRREGDTDANELPDSISFA